MLKKRILVHAPFWGCMAIISLLMAGCATTRPDESFHAASIKSIDIYAVDFKPGIYSMYYTQIEKRLNRVLENMGYDASVGEHLQNDFHSVEAFYKNAVKPAATHDAAMLVSISKLSTCRIYRHKKEIETLKCMQFMYWLFDNRTGHCILMGDSFKGNKAVCRFVPLVPEWLSTYSDGSTTLKPVYHLDKSTGKRSFRYIDNKGHIKQAYSYDASTTRFLAEKDMDYQWEKLMEAKFIENHVQELFENLPSCQK